MNTIILTTVLTICSLPASAASLKVETNANNAHITYTSDVETCYFARNMVLSRYQLNSRPLLTPAYAIDITFQSSPRECHIIDGTLGSGSLTLHAGNEFPSLVPGTYPLTINGQLFGKIAVNQDLHIEYERERSLDLENYGDCVLRSDSLCQRSILLYEDCLVRQCRQE